MTPAIQVVPASAVPAAVANSQPVGDLCHQALCELSVVRSALEGVLALFETSDCERHPKLEHAQNLLITAKNQLASSRDKLDEGLVLPPHNQRHASEPQPKSAGEPTRAADPDRNFERDISERASAVGALINASRMLIISGDSDRSIHAFQVLEKAEKIAEELSRDAHKAAWAA